MVVHQIGQDLDLKQLSVTLPFMRTEYEPEQFRTHLSPGCQQPGGCLPDLFIGQVCHHRLRFLEDAEEAASMLADTLGDAL